MTLHVVAKPAQHATTSPAVDPAYKQRMAAVASHGSHAPPATTASTPDTGTTAAQPGDETIHTTANHPWLSADRGWVVAGSLQLGEQVVRADGSTAEVVALTTVHGSAPMWDLTVSNVHDFAVGNGAYVVHNCNFGSNKSKIDWNEIESGHTEGGSRLSSRKTLFNGASRKEVRGIVKQAWRNRVKAGEQQIDLATGEVRQRWMGTAGRWKVTGVYNHTTDTVESAWPTFEHHLSFT